MRLNFSFFCLYTDPVDRQLGIVFTGGVGPQPQAIRLLIDSLKTEPLTVAADSGLLLAETAGIKPQWIIGDMDSLNESPGGKERLHNYPVERVISYPADKDYTDTELALTLLREKGCDITWIIGGGGGRIDHLLGIRDLFEREYFPRRWLTAAEDIFCIEDGSLTLGLDKDSLVSVFPLGAGPWKAESRGLKWPLDNVHWERGFYGLSNRTITEDVQIYASQGRFLIVCNANACVSV